MARTKVWDGTSWRYEDEVLNPTAIDSIQVNGVTQPIVNKTVSLSVPGEAEDISYDNTDSGLESDNVQDVIDEMQDEIEGKVDLFVVGEGLTFENNVLSADVTSGSIQRLGAEVEEAFGMMADNWTTNHSYAVGDYAIHRYQNVYHLYRCTTAHTSSSSFVPANWEEVQITDEIGSSSSGAFVVEFTENDDVYTANKTVKQIYDAYSEGRVVIGYLETDVFNLCECSFSSDGYSVKFSSAQDNDVATGTITLRALEVAQDEDEFTMSSASGTTDSEYIDYDNEDSGLTADNVQDALDELNSSKYSKPSTGIPSSDMTSEVQASLDKAETALQSVPNTYRTASAQDIIDGAKQAQNIQRNITIAVADWNSGTTCTKTVTGVTASNTVIVDPSDATVTATAQGADELTFTATATPSADVTVKVVILP